MKSTSKTMAAVALSLLVFPGTGHFVLGRYWRGLIWGGIFGLILVAMMGIFGVNLGKIMDGMMSPTGEVPFDMRQIMVLACLGLTSFVVWALAGLDAFWLARSMPKVEMDGVGVTPVQSRVPTPAPPPELP